VTSAIGHTDGVSIRRAERPDLQAVMRIEAASFPQPWPEEAFAYYLDRPGFLVACDPAAPITVVGFVVADTSIQDGRVVGHIKDLAVAPDQRARGIGSALVDAGLDRLAAADVATTRLEVRAGNEPARGLYRGFGFRPVGREEEYYRDGEDAVIMRRDQDLPVADE
jgi:ribosomal-protein-alanine N-acetyltransferase